MEKMDSVLKGKVTAIISVWVAFAILYTLLSTGNTMMTWVGVAIMAAANILLALKN